MLELDREPTYKLNTGEVFDTVYSAYLAGMLKMTANIRDTVIIYDDDGKMDRTIVPTDVGECVVVYSTGAAVRWRQLTVVNGTVVGLCGGRVTVVG